MATRWGIVGSGRISFEFAHAIRSLPREEHALHAAADENLLRATQLCTKHNIPVAYGSYEALATDPDIDVVHIGLIDREYLSITKLFLRSAKHVLCEKPSTVNREGIQELIAIAEEENLFLMEGLWSRFTPLYEKMTEEVESGTIGDVSHVEVNFKDGVATPSACYQLITLLLGKPVGIRSRVWPNGSVTVALTYDGGKSALVVEHTHPDAKDDAIIRGTRGALILHPPFWCPTLMTVLDRTYGTQIPVTGDSETGVMNNVGLRREAMEVRRCLRNGLNQSPRVSWDESLTIVDIEDEIRRQMAVSSRT